MLGMLIGSVAIGWLSDKFGRKNAFVFSTLIYMIGGCTVAALPGQPELFPWFVVCRFFSGVGMIGIVVASFTLAMEYTGPNKRMACGMFIGVPFAIGGLLVGFIAWAGVREWRALQLTCTVPWVLLFSFHWIIPESPRWLLANGKIVFFVISPCLYLYPF